MATVGADVRRLARAPPPPGPGITAAAGPGEPIAALRLPAGAVWSGGGCALWDAAIIEFDAAMRVSAIDITAPSADARPDIIKPGLCRQPRRAMDPAADARRRQHHGNAASQLRSDNCTLLARLSRRRRRLDAGYICHTAIRDTTMITLRTTAAGRAAINAAPAGDGPAPVLERIHRRARRRTPLPSL